jgi:hypothetical protein
MLEEICAEGFGHNIVVWGLVGTRSSRLGSASVFMLRSFIQTCTRLNTDDLSPHPKWVEESVHSKSILFVPSPDGNQSAKCHAISHGNICTRILLPVHSSVYLLHVLIGTPPVITSSSLSEY